MQVLAAPPEWASGSEVIQLDGVVVQSQYWYVQNVSFLHSTGFALLVISNSADTMTVEFSWKGDPS
jgi:hypothetical protein